MRRRFYSEWDEVPCILDAAELAGLLRLSRSAAYELMHTKGFPTVRLGRRLLVPKAALKEFLDKRLEETMEEY